MSLSDKAQPCISGDRHGLGYFNEEVKKSIKELKEVFPEPEGSDGEYTINRNFLIKVIDKTFGKKLTN